MFYDGDLQSGIALALQQSKSVVCFVRDDAEESTLWETQYLQDEEVSSQIENKTVILRMQAGSQEAGYLAAFYPISQVPALVVIHNGQLRAFLRSGLTQDQFKHSLLQSLNKELPTSSNPPPFPSSSSTSENQTPQTSNPERPQANTNSAASSSTIQTLLSDRRRRLSADKKAKDAAEKEERRAKAEHDLAKATADPNSAKAKQMSYAQQQRKRQQEAKAERERILKVIENDKLERREREERRKALAKAEAEAEANAEREAEENDDDGVGGLANQQLAKESTQSTTQHTPSRQCAVQVRLFDGGTIRSRFSFDATLRSNVRPWIDTHRSDGQIPYTFKQILAPQPNRAISISEEEESLQSLGLVPSATLVMLPVQGYTAAYASEAGLLSRGVSAAYNVVSGGVGLVTGTLGTFLGVGVGGSPSPSASNPDANKQSAPHATSSSRPTDAGTTNAGIRVRTLRDQRDDRDERQFYNGNQLNFEPRHDDDNDDNEEEERR